MTLRPVLLSSLLFAGVLTLSAQNAQLPPALRAAVLSGNPQAITQTINTLAGGNPARSAALATQVMQAAEQMLATNPRGAVQVAGAVVSIVRAASMNAAAPAQVEGVLTAAARIFAAPSAAQAAPDQVAQLATATITAAGSTGNPTLIANIANQAVSAAERILTASPAAAVQVAGAAVESVRQAAVQQGAAQQTMQVVTTASRIIVSPDAQRAAPAAVAGIATASAEIASTPAVYAANPSAAITVMSNAYRAASSAPVASAAPAAAASVSATLTQASTSPALAQINPSNAAQLTGIVSGQNGTNAQTNPATSTQTRASEQVADTPSTTIDPSINVSPFL